MSFTYTIHDLLLTARHAEVFQDLKVHMLHSFHLLLHFKVKEFAKNQQEAANKVKSPFRNAVHAYPSISTMHNYVILFNKGVNVIGP